MDLKFAVYFDIEEFYYNKTDDQVCFVRSDKQKKYFSLSSLKQNDKSKHNKNMQEIAKQKSEEMGSLNNSIRQR